MLSSEHPTTDITRIMLSILFISILMAGSFWVLHPFFSAFIWAVMIVIPTWPLMLRLTARLNGKRVLAVLIMSFFICLLIIIPAWLAFKTIAQNSDKITEWANALTEYKIPPPPLWIADVPLIGKKVTTTWEHAALVGSEDISAHLNPYFMEIIRWFPAQIKNAGFLVIHFILTMVISIILYCQGETAARGIRAFARRLAGDRGDQMTILAAQAIKAVAMGIVVTAFVQAIIAGLGLLIAGIPYAVLLTALIFVLSVVQIGALPVLLPTIIWLYWSGSPVLGTFFLIWSIIVMSLDNFLRPYLIKRGADLPLLLIFAGIIGGLISFGIIGLFVGPVILAVSYTLMKAWVEEKEFQTF